MNTICVDPVFGEMTYKHKWYKVQSEFIFGKKCTITIAAKAYSGKSITDQQRVAYQQYVERKDEYLKIAEDQLIQYVNSNLRELANYWMSARKIRSVTELSEIVTPKTLLFKQDGTFLLLLECVWDVENGIAVKLAPEVAVGSQYLFL